MWIELLKQLDPTLSPQIPASGAELSDLEDSLKINLPVDLKTLLQESNGIKDKYRSSFTWNTERIKKDNLRFRTVSVFKENYKPFDDLLFFADAGNGDQFAYKIDNGKILEESIYVWNHEDDSRKKVANSLKDFLTGWLTRKISI